MKLYLLTAATIGEAERPVCIGTDLEVVKAAAVLTEAYPPDEFNLYGAEDGAEPELIAYRVVRGTWDRDACSYSYALTDWSPA